MNTEANVNKESGSSLNMVVLPSSRWEKIEASIEEIKDAINGKAKEALEEEWLDSATARKVLGVSGKTWQNMRDRRQIEFTQIGRKIYVRRSAINEYFRNHSISK